MRPLATVRANLAALSRALQPMRSRGYSLPRALFMQLPAAVVLRAWRRIAAPLNGRVLMAILDERRFAAFQNDVPVSPLPRLYVIVMPSTLHFLVPCLALLHGHAQVILIDNGTRAWERKALRRYQPQLAMFRLNPLPLSSVPHGDVVSLLIRRHHGNFGIVDHDCYVFDERLLTKLAPTDDECMVGFFRGESQRTGHSFPLTHLLYFNAEALRALGERYRIDARQYRAVPASVQPAMARIAVDSGGPLKDYHDFYDTLHLLLITAMAEGMRVRYIPLEGEAPRVVHIGGTSIGSHHTKHVFALYTHRRFIELLGDAEIAERYAALTRPLRSSEDALARREPNDRAWDALPALNALVERLAAWSAAHGFAAPETH